MAKIIAYVISDIHFHDWKQFNEHWRRTEVSEEFLLSVFDLSSKNRVPILFGGDLFHTPKGLTNATISRFVDFMNMVQSRNLKPIVYGISGNHDMDETYSLYNSVCKMYPDIFKLLDNDSVELDGIVVHGIPYIKRNIGLVDKITKIADQSLRRKILLLHTELYGAPDPSGHIIEPVNLPRNLKALFTGINLVLAGHVHKHTRIEDNIYMIGAPNQQRKSDAGCEMGYLKIYEDLSVKFVPLNYPGFRYYQEGEEHEDTNDYWIGIPKPKKLVKSSNTQFKPTMDKTKMAKRYAEEIGETSKKRINTLISVLNATDN